MNKRILHDALAIKARNYKQYKIFDKLGLAGEGIIWDLSDQEDKYIHHIILQTMNCKIVKLEKAVKDTEFFNEKIIRSDGMETRDSDMFVNEVCAYAESYINNDEERCKKIEELMWKGYAECDNNALDMLDDML